MNTLTGQVAVVTGAARGIGRGIALVLAECGADVVVNDISADMQEVTTRITELGRRALAVQADVSLPADVARLFETTLAHFGRLDILVNNVGTSQAKDIFQIEPEDWERILRTNLTSCYLCSRSAMRIMARQRYGRIVNISSVVAHQGALFGHAHYAATKSGMLGITRTLARTGAPLGITVNAVAPGCIETELLHQTLGEKGVEEMRGKIPLGLGTPRDVGLAVAFLCGEGGRYITGATLDVNGGLYMR
ncbi:MAG: 3-oxoacyl-ACP reductase FabG [Verrucomicrobiae bacterium]|nr:3-oxoacyl-ACP reductase FabG [Verrucomicrobiae bacterium]